jgi:alpha-tubulin suppressor-like RCC1 family protein
MMHRFTNRALAMLAACTFMACPLDENESASEDEPSGSKGTFQRVSLWPRDGEVFQGEKLQMRAQSLDEYQYDLDDTYVFSSQNPNIVQITPDGLATGVSLGFATVEVRSQKYGKTTTTQLATVAPRVLWTGSLAIAGTEVEQDRGLEVTLTNLGPGSPGPILLDSQTPGFSLQYKGKVGSLAPGASRKMILRTSITTPVGQHKVRISVPAEFGGISEEFTINVKPQRPNDWAWKKVAFDSFAMALTTDGRLVEWGAIQERLAPPATLTTDIKDFAMGSNGVAVIHQDGTLEAWGKLSDAPDQRSESPIVIPAGERFQSVAFGNQYALGLTEAGKVLFLRHYELDARSGPRPDAIPSMPIVTAIGASNNLGVALDESGTIHTWGPFDRPGDGMNNVEEISASIGVVAARKKDGTVWLFQRSGLDPVQVPDIADATHISAGQNDVLIQRADGTVVQTRFNRESKPATAIPAFAGSKAVFAGSDIGGATVHIAIGQDGQMIPAGDIQGAIRIVPRVGAGIAEISGDFGRAGHATSIWVTHTDGSIAGFGYVDTAPSEIEDAPKSAKDIARVYPGKRAVLALKQDGTLIGWGGGVQGKVPPGLPKVKDVTVDGDNVIALLEDTSLVGWPLTNGVQLPSGPTGLNRIFADSLVVGLKPDGSFTPVAVFLNDSFAANAPKLEDWAPCASMGKIGGRAIFLSGNGGVLGDGFRDIKSLGCAWLRQEGDPGSSNMVRPMAIMGDSKIGLLGHSDFEDITVRDGFTRWSGRGAIRGQGDTATAQVPYSNNDSSFYILR